MTRGADQLPVGEEAGEERADGGKGVRPPHVEEDDAVSGPVAGTREPSVRRPPYAFRPRRWTASTMATALLGVGGRQYPVPQVEDVGRRLLPAAQHVPHAVVDLLRRVEEHGGVHVPLQRLLLSTTIAATSAGSASPRPPRPPAASGWR